MKRERIRVLASASFPSPSNLRFIQILQSSPGDSVRVVWEDHPSGLYLCRIESAASVQVTKIVRLR